MPPFRAEVTFRGLCALVPGKALEEGVHQEWVGIFLVDAGAKQKLDHQSSLCAHIPVVEYRLRDLVTTADGDPLPDDIGLWRIKDEDVVFRPSGTVSSAIKVEYAASVGPVPEPGEFGLLNWVIEVGKVFPKRGTVARQCFEMEPVAGRIIGRVHLESGHLSTSSLALVDTDDIVIAQLGSDIAHRQAVAASVKVVIHCGGDDPVFRIVARKFDGSGLGCLAFRPGSENVDVVKIEIKNVCGTDLPSISAAAPEFGDHDEDFRWNHLLSDDSGEPKPIGPTPFIVGKEVVPGGATSDGGATTAKCSPALFDAASKEQAEFMKDLANNIQLKSGV